ncbi:hypothetical protein SAMN05216326_1178 [Nitrosomonas marina]|uniref:CDP-Glycerol:Poly(Glycerophosphate) glycerophosphotransferase n=2 Tax=Nitrosomonas marina TaxID=917 RepID=A0A1I0CY88_9PROT|nr:hypothetical protein SAMN05216326_1178 [Nitrosomonas marina]
MQATRLRLMRQALFFLRHYNDIDHIVPVIYKWSRSGFRCTVVLISFSSIARDYRIQFIASLAGVKVLNIQNILTTADQCRFRFLSLALYGHSGRYISHSLYHLFEVFWPVRTRMQFWDKLATFLLKTAFPPDSAGVVVFDWVSQKSTLPIEFVRHVLALSRKQGHISVSLPHGDSPHYNELIRNHEFHVGPQAKYAHSDMFDYIVCPNELCAKRYRPFIDEAKIKILGSPRYNDEWLNVLHRLLPPPVTRKHQQKIYIVFFLRKKEFSLFWDEIQRVIRMVIQFENIRLIIKPHTRDYLQTPLKQILRQIQSSRLEVAQDSEHSASLIASADMIIDVATSVAFEAVKRGIPVLSADYLHAGYSAISHYIPESAMHCRDDIYHAVRSFAENPHRPFYDERHRADFIRHMLDVPDKYVLERYVGLLAGHVQTAKKLAA